MGLAAVGHHRLAPGISLAGILKAVVKVGSIVETLSQPTRPSPKMDKIMQ